jgi:pyruvate dehydrogenase E2 component (dihydrolipoamide acetyltransferase)
MITQVILPKLGQTMEEGAIVESVKEEGKPVARGDVLFTVESDKEVLEVEATARGYLRKILIPAGQTVSVLTPVAIITREADEDISEYQAASGKAAPKHEEQAGAPSAGGPATPAEVASEPRPTEAGDGRIFASPRARKAARERDVALTLVAGTGPHGRIVEKDVLGYIASQPKATPMAVQTAAATGVDLATVSGTGVSGRIMRADVEAAMPGSLPPAAEAAAAERVP